MGFPLQPSVMPPTVEAVSAAMRKARYLEAVGDGGRVIASGWRCWQEAGEVRVTRLNMYAAPGVTFQEMTDTALERYAAVLKVAGWRVAANAQGGFITVLGPGRDVP